jgi:NAD(P)-dependent dehydrogenase (short-subunit alcohol dehydrogenase family)
LPLVHDGGSIDLDASIAASKGNPASSVYSATKAAVGSFARMWTMELKERKIRVNALSPGPIKTRLQPSGGIRATRPADVDEHRRQGTMARFGTQDGIARAALFLASDDSIFVTGTGLFIDGGPPKSERRCIT